MTKQPTVEPHNLDALLAHVKGQESRIDGVERAVDVLGRRFDKSFNAVNEKLDALAKAAAITAAQPQYRVGDVLDVVTKASALLGMAAAAIIYIATSISSAPLASMDQRLRALERPAASAYVAEKK